MIDQNISIHLSTFPIKWGNKYFIILTLFDFTDFLKSCFSLPELCQRSLHASFQIMRRLLNEYPLTESCSISNPCNLLYLLSESTNTAFIRMHASYVFTRSFFIIIAIRLTWMGRINFANHVDTVRNAIFVSVSQCGNSAETMTLLWNTFILL